ncbi:transcription factor HES-7.1-A-like [Heterodontus francisci]|uniref:transcription factor HES-7.1-A-like n=1 Tax=Heterodontus francisci TaxID=7792 RepID=UPI00355AD9A1
MNRSLDQLKSFLLKHTQSESFRNGKMEKAEILEMTVQYLKNAALANGQEHQGTEVTRQNYEAGFKECLLQVNSFVRSCARFNAQTKSSLMERLALFVDESIDEKHSRRLPECVSSSAPNLQPLRPGQLDSESWDVVPAAANTKTPTITSNPSAHKVSNLLTTRPTASHQTLNRFNFIAKNHELNHDSGSAQFRDFPQKIIVSPKPVFAQQDSARMTVSHNVWRPWP